MPSYTFKCMSCGNTGDVYMSMSEYKEVECGECKIVMRRIYQVPQVNAFHPYVEENMSNEGKSIYVRSKSHRDKLCRKHHVSYDKSSNLRPKYKQPNSGTLSEVGFKNWAEATKKARGKI